MPPVSHLQQPERKPQKLTFSRGAAVASARSTAGGGSLWTINHGDGADIVSGLRGKLLEIKHLEMIQKSLEHGYTAHLAESPNQAGWDIVINDPHGHVVQLIQDKVNPIANVVLCQQGLSK